MKSIFDKQTRDEVIIRINTLSANSQPRWGKMTVTQMVRHCSLCEEYYYGNINIKRSFLGRLLGKMAINSILQENASFRKNARTPQSLKVTDDIDDLLAEKEKWKQWIEKYETFEDKNFTHWFFGRMTRYQLGQFIYKHGDHHLKQFGV